MPSCFANRANADTRILLPVFTTDYKTWLKEQPAEWQAWLAATGFKGEAGEVGFLPAIDGPPINGKEKRPAQVVIAIEAPWNVWSLAGLPASLPEGRFRLEADLAPDEATRLALGWALGCYRFARYRKNDRPAVELVWPANADRKRVESMAAAIAEVRDLVNTPAGDLGPEQLAETALDLAKSFKAKASQFCRGRHLSGSKIISLIERKPLSLQNISRVLRYCGLLSKFVNKKRSRLWINCPR